MKEMNRVVERQWPGRRRDLLGRVLREGLSELSDLRLEA